MRRNTAFGLLRPTMTRTKDRADVFLPQTRPRVGPDNAPFWQGCREQRLVLPTCRACGKALQ
jgi:hypothetical protein